MVKWSADGDRIKITLPKSVLKKSTAEHALSFSFTPAE
jgi:hypothetical protein